MIQKSQKNKSSDSFASVGIGILSLEGVMRMRAEDENEISKWGFGKREKLELKDCSLE